MWKTLNNNEIESRYKEIVEIIKKDSDLNFINLNNGKIVLILKDFIYKRMYKKGVGELKGIINELPFSNIQKGLLYEKLQKHFKKNEFTIEFKSGYAQSFILDLGAIVFLLIFATLFNDIIWNFINSIFSESLLFYLNIEMKMDELLPIGGRTSVGNFPIWEMILLGIEVLLINILRLNIKRIFQIRKI